MVRLTLILTFCICAILARGQENWSLERCINYAQQNSISMRQAENNIRAAELNERQSVFDRLPSLNASMRGGLQFGRTIDPTTNTFRNDQLLSNSFSLDAGITLFDGNRINNNIKRNRLDLQAAEYDAQANADILALNIANAYLQILLAEEQLANAEKQLELSQNQLERTIRLIEAGSLPINERYQIESQVALDQQAIIEARNSVDIGYLNLRQLMELPPDEVLRIEAPELEIPSVDPDNFTFREVYQQALNVRPEIKVAELQLESAEVGRDIARANFFPTLNFFGSLNTNYSNQSRRQTGSETVLVPQTLIIEDMPVDVLFEQEFPTFSESPYFSQLNDNFGQSLGLNLSIPIYNNHRNKIGVEQAELNALNTQLNNLQVRQQLQQDVQNAIANAKAAQRSYQASRLAVASAEASFENAEKQFQAGAIDSYAYFDAQNNLDQAQVNLLRAKYQYVFNVIQVQFYQGQQITVPFKR